MINTIIGLEDYNTYDYSLLATLEDEIIKDFVTNGYKIYERDNDMLYRLIAEESLIINILIELRNLREQLLMNHHQIL